MAVSARKVIASFELLLAAGLWGFGFIATVWGFAVFSPFELTFLRFALAGMIGLIFLVWASGREAWGLSWRLSFVPALLLALTLIFQTWGLKYTTATKSGFITTLYVVFVPILESMRTRTKLPLALWGCVGLALFGTGLIVNVTGFETLNVGDVLTFICALFATFQIYYLSQISARVKTPFVFNLVQAGWGALIVAPLLYLEPILPKLAAYATWPREVWLGLAALTFGSTIIAFYLQVRAQKHLSATVSSLLFLLESPFALIFALALLNESLNQTETAGAILIFMSAAAASVIEARRKRI